MQSTSVTSKGQVTIPKALRQRLGIRTGTRVEFILTGDRVELRVLAAPAAASESGFGMLKSGRPALPADFDPASLLAK